MKLPAVVAVAALFAWTAGASIAAMADPVSTRGGTFDANVPPPERLLGFVPGERPVRYEEMVSYLEAVSATSPRVKLARYGRTATGRQLLVLTVSAPQNMARADVIQAQLGRLGSARLQDQEARQLIASLPASIWMGYGIHGNEISGPDAALELVYRLAAGEDAATRELLNNVLVHVDPMVNPDGRERHLAHVTAFSSSTANEDQQDLSRTELWPDGRGNHYFFDLNRDAVFAVQPEARARVSAILAARPQLLTDAHEMGTDSTFLFAVPAQPLNPHLPASVHRSWQEFAIDHAAAFDRDGTSFYTRAWNEVFYPGYFDIWPAYQGAVPIIYEQAGTGGTSVKLANGLRRSYAQAVEHQLRSSLANLATAAKHRDVLLTRWWQARSDAAHEVASARRVWVVLPDDDYKLRRITSLLRTQQIQAERLSSPVKASGLHSMWEGQARPVELPAGSLLVRSAQPLRALVQNIFDWHVPMDPQFLHAERRRLDLGNETLLYDTTAWSLPHAFAASVFWSEDAPRGDWQPLGDEEESAPVVKDVTPGRYGYLYQDPSLHATARLLARGVKVRIARDSFMHSDVRYLAGTLLIRTDDQADAVADELRAEQARGDTTFVPVDSARILDGPDLGDDRFRLLAAPAIAVLTGSGISAVNTGAIRHLFDATMGVALTLLDFTRLGDLDLSRYNVLVLADVDDASSIAALLGAGRLQQLKQWVESGGTLIALRGGALALAEAGLSASKPRETLLEKYPPLMFGRTAREVVAEDFLLAVGARPAAETDDAGSAGATAPVLSAAVQAMLPRSSPRSFVFPVREPTLERWLEGTPGADGLKSAAGQLLRKYLPRGAYLSCDLKPMHWLRYGVADRIPVMFRESETLIAQGAAEPVGRYGEPRELALAGLVWPEALGYIAGTSQLVREQHGRGQIILFANDPVFRGYSLGTQRLFLNAAILGPSFR